MSTKEPHPCVQVDKIVSIKEDTQEIKADMKDVKADLNQHMSRTSANEARLEIMEEFIKTALQTQQDNFSAMLKSNKDNQAALNKQLKIALGVFAALAVLVSALVPLINH